MPSRFLRIAGTFVGIAAMVGACRSDAPSPSGRDSGAAVSLTGCYQLSYSNRNAVRWNGDFPTRIELGGGPDEGAAAWIPTPHDTGGAWRMYYQAMWRRTDAGVAINFSTGYGGLTLELTPDPQAPGTFRGRAVHEDDVIEPGPDASADVTAAPGTCSWDRDSAA